jgi:O-antigen/teichoic acid export membrane protein
VTDTEAEEAGDYDSLAGSVARGGLFSLGGQAATFASSLLATPFTIRLLGPSKYGLWSLLQTSLTWVGLADIGMSQASTRFGADSVAKQDTEGEVTAIWTAAAITISVTTCAAIVVALCAVPILRDLLHVHGKLFGPGVLAFRIISMTLVTQAVIGTLNTPQVIRLKWRSYTVVTTGSGVLRIVALPVALAAAAGGLVTAALVALGAGIVGAIGTIWAAAMVQPAIKRPRTSRKLILPLLRYGGPLSVAGIAYIPLATAERLLLAHFHSTVVVAHYVVAATLASMLTVIPGSVAGPLFPALVRLTESGQVESARSLYRQALQGSFLVMTPAACVMAFIAHPFLGLWAGSSYARYSAVPFYVLLAGVWFNSLAWIPYTHMLASNKTTVIARIHLAELVPYLVAGAILTSAYGALGAAIVSSARVTIDSVVFFISATRGGNMPLAFMSTRKLRSACAPATLGAVLLGVSFVVPNLVGRLGCLVLLLGIYAVGVWLAVLTPLERNRLRDLGASAVPRIVGWNSR